MDWLKKKVQKVVGTESGPAQPAAEEQPTQPVTVVAQRTDKGSISTQVRLLGRQQSNLPHIFRDGGGGGTVDGLPLIIFSDGMYTTGPPPTNGRGMVSFTSNSLAVVGTSIATVTDAGTPERGPDQAVPFCEGEVLQRTGVWPNQNIAPLPDRTGIAFPEVIDRQLFAAQKDPLLYNTAIIISLQGGRPHVARPHKSLFLSGELMFGSFTAVPRADDGYLYAFARVSITDKPACNGLKLARVPLATAADRSQYEYWDGHSFSVAMPALDDAVSNVYYYSQEAFGKHYGPGTGDIFWSELYGKYLLVFQNAAAALDNSVYMCYSTSLTGGWSSPTTIFKLPHANDGYSYAFHAYPDMDPSGRRVPVTWTQDSKAESCFINTGEILFGN